MSDRRDIDDIRARVDIVSVVEPYVTLKRAGRNFKGLCPFHQEKTPSFTVNPELGTWYCFGSCGEGGDVFKFVQKVEHLSFPEALERLALRAGVTLTRDFVRSERFGTNNAGLSASPEAGEKDRLYKVNLLALNYYRDMLRRAPAAQEYLQERQIAHAAQEAFQIGFAPDTWEGLSAHLAQKGVSLADAEKAGLVTKNERGGYFDKLRGRLVFPIFDVHERPVAFGGRLIEGEARAGQPKYWNSPETPIFSKSGTLYGLSRARKAIGLQQKSVVVEGYTDVVACHQAEFENVVATLGTSLTEEHVRILSRLAPTVLLAFDADSAGLKAAFRAAEIFEAQEVEVRVIDMPEGEDPDSLLRGGNRHIFEQAMENAMPLTEYRLKRLLRRPASELSDRDRVALFEKTLPILASVKTPALRAHYMKMALPYHPQYGVRGISAQEYIQRDVEAYLSGRYSHPSQQSVPRPAYAPVPTSSFLGSATEQAERHLLRALLSEDRSLGNAVRAGILPEEFDTGPARDAAAALYTRLEETPDADPQFLLSAVESEDSRTLLMAAVMASDEEPLSAATITDEIRRLKLRAKEHRLTALKAQIAGGDADAQILRQFIGLQSEIKGSPQAS